MENHGYDYSLETSVADLVYKYFDPWKSQRDACNQLWLPTIKDLS